jgi:hypothetical protein
MESSVDNRNSDLRQPLYPALTECVADGTLPSVVLC